MGRRFPLTTPVDGGQDVGEVGAAPWLAVKPAPGAAYGTGGSNGHYTIADSGVRGGAATGSFCLVHLCIEPTVPQGPGARTMWDCNDATFGHRMRQIESAGPQLGWHEAKMGTATVDADTMDQGGFIPGGGHNPFGILINGITWDPGYGYPSGDIWVINGKNHADPGSFLGWEPNGAGDNPMTIGVNSDGTSEPMLDWIVGAFFHAGALSQADWAAINLSIQTNKKIVPTDLFGELGFALDNVWDVATALTAGSPAATIASVGAAGTIPMTLVGALDVVEVEANMSAR